MITPDTSWITDAVRVAIYTTEQGKPVSVQVAVVERLTATQIILKDVPTKYRRATLEPVGGSGDTWSTRTTVLLPVNDPQVIAARAAIRVRKLQRTIAEYARPNDLAGALTVLDYIEQAAADTRAQINALTAQRIAEGK